MKIWKILSILLAVLSFSFFKVNAIPEKKEPNSVVLIPIPKCGSALIVKCVQLLTGRSAVPHYLGENWQMSLTRFLALVDSCNQDYFLCIHLMHTPTVAQILNEKKCTVFFIYRDPRDQIISSYFYINHKLNPWPVNFFSKNMDEFIFNMIEDSSLAAPFKPTRGILNFYQEYLRWMNEPGVYSIRFEDLVGPQGGGDEDIQKQVLVDIMNHLELSLISRNFDYLARSLFGGTQTFHEGKVGLWKKYFTEEHKIAFKKAVGQLLIDLGYEKDFDW